MLGVPRHRNPHGVRSQAPASYDGVGSTNVEGTILCRIKGVGDGYR